MNAFSYPSKRGINFAKIRGFKVTDYIWGRGWPFDSAQGPEMAIWGRGWPFGSAQGPDKYCSGTGKKKWPTRSAITLIFKEIGLLNLDLEAPDVLARKFLADRLRNGHD